MNPNSLLRQQRFVRNWRLDDVAEYLGTTVSTVHRWETGQHIPSAYYRAKLCELFGLSAQELGFTASIQENNPVPILKSILTDGMENQALWTVPYIRNRYFTGREELLQHLEQVLTIEHAGLSMSVQQTMLPRMLALKGLGGVGKTQIAVEYAYRALQQQHYHHILWISAANEESILAGFVDLAGLQPAILPWQEKDQSVIVPSVLRWLEACNDPWLLIYDNADGPFLLPAYLPHWGRGSILFTTRAHAIGAISPSIEVDALSPSEGAQLLLRRVRRFEAPSQQDLNDVKKIVLSLAHFPLAIDQAGAYIEETGCSVQEYLRLYQQQRYVLLARRGGQISGHPESVIATWSALFYQIEQTNPAAAELLQLCSFVDPDRIPEELLTQGAPYWPTTLQDAMKDLLRFNQMLETLLSFSLIKRTGREHTLSLHRLVQIIQRELMTLEKQCQWAERLVLAVHALFPADPNGDVDSWLQCQRLLEQAQICDTLIQQYDFHQIEAVTLLERTGIYLRERGVYARAEPLLARALQIQKQWGNANDLHTAEIQLNLAYLYAQLGRNAEAEVLCQQALAIREQCLGPEHLQTILSSHGLALMYEKQGKYDQAKVLYLRALRIQEDHLDSDHPFVAYSLDGLADALVHQDEDDFAESLYLQAINLLEQPGTGEHPHLAYPLTGLANLYARRGKDTKAESLYQRALAIRERHLGLKHLETATTLHAFARFRQRQGRFSESISLYQRARAIREQLLGSAHPLTIQTHTHLSEVLSVMQHTSFRDSAGQ